MVTTLLTILLLGASTQEAHAAPLNTACSKMVNGEQTGLRKCVSHGESFELKSEFVDACTAFSPDLEIRWRCLKSGANLEILQLCKSSGWSQNGKLTCLRSYPSKEILAACKKFGRDEEEQIRCLRLGREPPQMVACMNIGSDQKSRFSCLQMDVPAMEAHSCNAKNSSTDGRLGCLENFVAAREGEYWNDQKELRGRSLASENPISEPVKLKNRRK